MFYPKLSEYIYRHSCNDQKARLISLGLSFPRGFAFLVNEVKNQQKMFYNHVDNPILTPILTPNHYD